MRDRTVQFPANGPLHRHAPDTLLPMIRSCLAALTLPLLANWWRRHEDGLLVERSGT